jgi:hypothetical protein
MFRKASVPLLKLRTLCSVKPIARANSGLIIYGFPLSQPTRSVLLLCHANDIPYDFKIVDAIKGENRKSDFLKIHPAGNLLEINCLLNCRIRSLFIFTHI